MDLIKGTPPLEKTSSHRISVLSRWSMLLGNLFEHYDTALFTLLSPFLAPLFFPLHDPATALLLTYCIIPLGMLARPIGSLFFGYIGDTRSRKEALMLSLLGMAVVTGCLGFLPTYEQAGILAPVLLSLGRILQNFFGSGEHMGGAIYLIENVPESEKDLMSSYFNASTIAGILIASFGVSVICGLGLFKECWRALYFFGCSTALFAFFLRLKMSFHPKEVPQSPEESSLKFILKSCWESRNALFTIAVASGFSYACYTIALVTLNGFIPLVTSITKDEMMHLNTVFLCFDFLLLPVFGRMAKRFSREKMMMAAGALSALAGIPLFGFLEGASLWLIVIIRFILVVLGVWFSAPFHSWAQKLVPPSRRYTILSFAYALGSQLLGGPSAAISLWMYQATHSAASVGAYWMILGLLTTILIARHKYHTHKLKKPLPS